MIKIVQKYFQRIEWLFITIFIVSLPAIFTTKLMDPALYSRFLGLSWLLLALSLIFLFRLYKNGFNFSFSRIEWIIFLCVLTYFLSHLISSFGVLNSKEAIFKTLKEGALMLYFFYIYINLRSSPKARNVLIKAIISSTLFFLLIGVYQLFKADFSKFTNATEHYAYYLTQALINVKSTLANKNPFSSFLFLSMPFLMYGVLLFKKHWRIISIITLLLNLLFLGLLVSKTVWAAFGLFSAVVFVLFLVYLFFVMPKNTGKTLSSFQKIAILVFPVLFVAGSIVFIAKSDIKVFKVISDKVLQVIKPDEHLFIYSKDNPSSLETRTLAWGKTVKMIAENPLLGVGPGHWRMYLPKYGIDEFGPEIRKGTTHFQRTHNDFLWIAAEVGLIGLLCYLSIYGLVLFLAFRNFYNSQNREVRVLNGLVFAALLGYIVILFISFSRERIPHNVVYLAMFALVIFDRGNFSERFDKMKKMPKVLSILGVFFLFFSGFNLYVANDVFEGEKEFRKLRYFQIVKKSSTGMLRSAKKLEGSFYTIDPFSTPIAYHKGTAEHRQNNIKAANKSFQEAYKMHPYNIQVIMNLATSYDLLGKPDKAISLYQEALNISPRYMDALLNVSIVYYNKKDYEKAFGYFSRIPYKKNLTERYHKAAYAISAYYALTLKEEMDIEKLNDWVQDKNKVIALFVKFQQENTTFSQVLSEQLKK